MNTIKGLITKDLLQLKSYRKTLIIYIFIFVFTGIVQETSKGVGVMIASMITLGFGMFSMASFNYDEQSKTDRYILTFPLTKKEVLIAKYILVIGSSITGAILGIILSLIIVFVIEGNFPNIFEYIGVAIGSILGVGLIQAIQIPCVYKWGAEKGRIQMFIVAAIIILLIGGVFVIGERININLQIDSFLNIVINILPLILLFITFIIYYISYRISYKIYINKEE